MPNSIVENNVTTAESVDENQNVESNSSFTNEENNVKQDETNSSSGEVKKQEQETGNENEANESNTVEKSEPVIESSGIDDVVSKLGQSKLDEIYNSYEEIEKILSDNDALEQLSKEEIINLTRQKAELEKFISEIEPLLEQQKQQAYNETIGKYGDGVKQVVEDLFGNDLDVDQLNVLDEFISRIKDSLVPDNSSTSPTKEQEVNIGKKIAGKDNTQVDGGQSLNDMLLSDDPAVREAAVKRMDELMDMYIKQNK